MDKHRFTEGRTGDLFSFSNLNTGKSDWLFVPNEMPPTWEFPEWLKWPLLADAKEALGTLNGIGQLLENADLLLSPLQTREAITSSSIEGTFVTPEQLLLYELNPREPDSPDSKMADWKEVFNYGRALKQGCQMLNELPVCSRVIREMHKTLMAGVRGERKAPGEFRKTQVQIGSAAKYVPPPPTEVPRLMSNLEKYINEGDSRYDPLVLCYVVHYQFEAIHPFNDGNGRVGRLLLSLMLYKRLNHAMPWLYMSSYFEKYKEEYADNLFRVSTHGDWERWIEFCLTGTVVQAKDAVRRCHQFKRIRQEYHDKDKSPTSRSYKIIDQLFTTPVVTVTSIKQQFDITYHTARSDLERLAAAGILSELPNVQPRSFYAREIMLVAFGEQDEAESNSDPTSRMP